MFLILILLSLVVIYAYVYLTKNFDYWEKRNIKYERPIPFFGSLYRNVMGKISFNDLTTELYNKYPNEKVIGIYHGTTPELIIRDLEVARSILNVDFAHFYPRGLGRDPKKEPLFLNLFHVDGDRWKLLRQRLTPAFTTAKLKKMFPLVVECAEKLQQVGDGIIERGGECDVRDLMARFTTEFIGACGFGLQIDSINNENSTFRNFGRMIFNRNRSWSNMALVILPDLLPDFSALFQTMFGDPTVLEVMTDMVKNVCAQRNDKPSNRHDFIDLLLELAEKQKIIGESIEKRDPDGGPVQVDMEMDFPCMVAQVFIFFAAGFETSSSATSYLLHQLAFHPEEQTKIQENIDQVLAKYDNKLCFDSIAEMTALSNAFKEGMRKFPSLGTLHRVCAKRFTIPEVGLTLDPGVKIVIPVQAIQNDEQYFENPSKFMPDRFAAEERNKYTYLPFGEGPRMCMGARLGEMQSLAGLAAVLHKFTVEPGPSTKRVPMVNPASNTVQSIQGGLPLKLTRRRTATKA